MHVWDWVLEQASQFENIQNFGFAFGVQQIFE